ncbi:transforming growth factor-beta-induced protein ig-h3-like [Mytilus trossulus]|uniref:transforming growth factor-beta-induced protein ig-h3-like n=1 Tax=Mytilus trossulus TaxID=6551 RepID=UPI0030054B8B
MFRYCCIFLAVHCVLGGNLIEVLKFNDASRLIQYATACGLADTILGGTYTIFAPTNAAFDALGTEQELLSDKTVLTAILLYHLTNKVIRKYDVQDEQTVESVAGMKLRLNKYSHNNAVTVEGAKISKFFYDLDASNGIVQVIDKVMIPPTGGITDLVSGNKDLSTLLSLFQKASIAGLIQSDPLTLFAPTNAAFSRLSANITSRLNSDNQLLIDVLEYHLVAHTEYSSGFYNRCSRITLLRSEYITLNVSDTGIVVNSNANVTKKDIPATNGIVHVIDHVLIPRKHRTTYFKLTKMLKYFGLLFVVGSVCCGNLVEVLQADGESKLIKYVTAAGLAPAILGGTYTIFAPTDAAFDAIGTEAELLKDTTALATILKYHVVKGTIPSSAAKNELQLETLAGAKIRFNIYSHNNAVTVEGSKITKFDLSASNGVVHVINKVMMPPTGDIVDLVLGNNDLSTLLTQVQNAGLVNALKGDALTVFAPTNAAFASLGPSLLAKLASNKDLLTEILEYHVVPHTEYSEGLYNRETLRTIDRHHDRIRIHTRSDGSVVVNSSKVTKADISATNGVVHVIDHVLIPFRYRLQFGFGK